MSEVNLSSAAFICKQFDTLKTLTSEQQRTAKATLEAAKRILSQEGRVEGEIQIYHGDVASEKKGLAAIEEALGHLKFLAKQAAGSSILVRKELDQYVPQNLESIDWAKQPTRAWILDRKVDKYILVFKLETGEKLSKDVSPTQLQLIHSEGIKALGVDPKDYAGSTPVTIFGVTLDTRVKKIAAVGIGILAVGTLGAAAGLLLRAGPAQAPRQFHPLESPEDFPPGCQYAVNISSQVLSIPRPIPIPPNWEACKLYDQTFYRNQEPEEQVSTSRVLLAHTGLLEAKTTSSRELRRAFNEVALRGASLQEVSTTVHLGRDTTQKLQEEEARLGKALLQRYVENGTTPKEKGTSTTEIQEVYRHKSDDLKRAERLLKKSDPWLDDTDKAKAEASIQAQRKTLETWRRESLAPIKEKWEQDLRTARDMAQKPTADIESVEASFALLISLSSQITEEGSAFDAGTLDGLTKGIKTLRGALLQEVSTKYAERYVGASIEALAAMAESLVDNPQGPPRANPHLERQREALQLLPKGSRERYQEELISIQQELDTYTRSIARELSASRFDSVSVYSLKEYVKRLDEINTWMSKFSKTRGSKSEAVARNLESFRTAIAGAKLAVAQQVTNRLDTLDAADRARTRKWIIKVLHDLELEVREHLPERGKAVEPLRTKAEGTTLGTWWEKFAASVYKALERPL